MSGPAVMQSMDVSAWAQTEELVAKLRSATPHPLARWWTEAELRAMVALGAEARVELVEAFDEREKLIKLSSDDDEGDPYRFGWELPHWREADADLRAVLAEVKAAGKTTAGQYCSGGKRATKSERVAWRTVQAAMAFPRGKIWCFQGNEKTSIAEQQSLIWKYLPREVKDLNRKSRQGWAKVNYTPENGFAAGSGHLLVLPNRTELHFLTYNMMTKDFQGWKLGAPLTRDMEALLAACPWLFNVGAWLDEDAPLDWLTTARTRCSTNGAVWFWTFSTLEGITPTIKELLVGHRTVRSRRAKDLPANLVHVPDCPAGEMPFMARVKEKDVSVVYFHTDMNPFPGNYENMRGLVEHRPNFQIMRDLYGYCEDTRHRAIPLFGAWNIIKRADMPDGTNFHLVDPHGSRMWASIWVRVSATTPKRYYIYRDWPDKRRFGDWAIPNKMPKDVNGDPGPAQDPRNYGYIRYKQAWLAEEQIHLPLANEQPLDKQRMNQLHKALKKAGFRPPYGDEARGWLRENPVMEAIFWRVIDSRAGKEARVATRGGTCIQDELAKVDYKPGTAEVEAPSMTFVLASGQGIAAGLREICNLTDWNSKQKLTPIMNEPRLYVVEECEQMIWAAANYVEDGPEDAGCEDFVALLRYMATSDLPYIPPREQWVETRTGGY